MTKSSFIRLEGLKQHPFFSFAPVFRGWFIVKFWFKTPQNSRYTR
jgi:hypothetical protein